MRRVSSKRAQTAASSASGAAVVQEAAVGSASEVAVVQDKEPAAETSGTKRPHDAQSGGDTPMRRVKGKSSPGTLHMGAAALEMAAATRGPGKPAGTCNKDPVIKRSRPGKRPSVSIAAKLALFKDMPPVHPRLC
jgi:hypothetical protein